MRVKCRAVWNPPLEVVHHVVTSQGDNLAGLGLLGKGELVTRPVVQDILKVADKGTFDNGLHPSVSGAREEEVSEHGHEVPALVAKDQARLDQGQEEWLKEHFGVLMGL